LKEDASLLQTSSAPCSFKKHEGKKKENTWRVRSTSGEEAGEEKRLSNTSKACLPSV